MVMRMNKTGFVKELANKLNCSEDYSRKIIDILEENFIIGKKNKEKTISNLMANLSIDEEEANNVYNIASNIIATEIKEKIKHPFRSKD